MRKDLPLRCQCGHVRAVARDVAPSSGFRFFCYCKDCQAFARVLDRPDVLDAAGGTDIFQLPPGRVKITAGLNALRCLRLSDNAKVLRWYADCCRTPIANTASSPRFPVVGLVHSVMDSGDCSPLIRAQMGSRTVSVDALANPLGPRFRGDERIAARLMRDALLGPPLCRIYERSATSPLPSDAPPGPSLGVFLYRASKLLGWWARGLGRPHPFFDERTGAPLSAPRLCTSAAAPAPVTGK